MLAPDSQLVIFSMASRRLKRRRIERADDEIIELSSSPPRELDDADKDVAETEPSPAEQAPPEEIDVEAFAKEREIWDAFREEHYEGTPRPHLYVLNHHPHSRRTSQYSSSCLSPFIVPLRSFKSWTSKHKACLLILCRATLRAHVS